MTWLTSGKPLPLVIPIIVYIVCKIKYKGEKAPEGYASFEKRTLAYLIDFNLFLITDYLVRTGYLNLSFTIPIPPDVIILGLSFLNILILPAITGWSIGKRFTSIKIVKKDNKKAYFIDILYREIVKNLFSVEVIFLGCLWMFFGKNRLTWHDSVADTRVVNIAVETTKKNWSIKFAAIILLFFPLLLVALYSIQTKGKPAIKDNDGKGLKNSIGMEFVYIKPGKFVMGSSLTKKDKDMNATLHQVALTKGFYMQTTEVTQGQWKAVMGNNPSHFNKHQSESPSYTSNRPLLYDIILPYWLLFFHNDNYPVEGVSWNDTQEFIEKLNKLEGDKYRLPTEAEWEYAARAGSTAQFCFGDNTNSLKDYAWYENNSGAITHPVAQKKPNVWGLYDMHGNVWEWCEDLYDDYPIGPVANPTGPEFSYDPQRRDRVLRGGSWDNRAWHCRSACRNAADGRSAHYGFRLVLVRSQQDK